MLNYKGTCTNDETFTETFVVTTPGVDITNWVIEFRIGCQDATVTKDLVNNAFTVTLPLSTMQGFCPGSYPVGGRYTENGITTQILVGSMSVAEGNFRA